MSNDVVIPGKILVKKTPITNPTNQQHPNLINLPVEMIQEICEYLEPVDLYALSLVKEIEEIVKDSNNWVCLDEREERQAELEYELRCLGCVLREDSKLCQDFIEKGEGNAHEIAIIMTEMKWYFAKTCYDSARWVITEYEGGWDYDYDLDDYDFDDYDDYDFGRRFRPPRIRRTVDSERGKRIARKRWVQGLFDRKEYCLARNVEDGPPESLWETLESLQRNTIKEKLKTLWETGGEDVQDLLDFADEVYGAGVNDTSISELMQELWSQEDLEKMLEDFNGGLEQ